MTSPVRWKVASATWVPSTLVLADDFAPITFFLCFSLRCQFQGGCDYASTSGSLVAFVWIRKDSSTITIVGQSRSVLFHMIWNFSLDLSFRLTLRFFFYEIIITVIINTMVLKTHQSSVCKKTAIITKQSNGLQSLFGCGSKMGYPWRAIPCTD